MAFEITTHVTVGANGHIELNLPELMEGQEVRLLVTADPAPTPRRRGLIGSLRGGGLSHMSEDFDDPLAEFAEYQ